MASDKSDDKMLAAVYTRYGGPEVVTIQTVPRPKPRPNEVLIRIRAASVSSGDMRVRSLTMPAGFGLFARPMFGFLGPRQRILGSEHAGTVEAVGAKVTKWKVGDQVFAFPDIAMGSHAQYRTMPEDGRIAPMPAGLDFAHAAALCFGGITALTFLCSFGKVKQGDSVLVIGASGAVGSAAVQIASRHLGATVTGLTSTPNVELVKSLGAHHVIDYKLQPDWVEEAAKDPAKRYDCIFDTVGAIDFSEAKKALKEEGVLLMAAASLWQILAGARGGNGKQKAIGGGAMSTRDQVLLVKELADKGLCKPVVERTFPLERISEAHAIVDSGRKRGCVVVLMD